jgi:hypothetical protein
MTIIGKLRGRRLLGIRPTAIISTPPTLSLQRPFNAKRRLKIRTGIGVSEAARTRILQINMELTVPIEHHRVLYRPDRRGNGFSATGQRLAA